MSSVGKASGDHGAGASNFVRQGETRQSQQGQIARSRHQTPADSISKQTRFSSGPQFDMSLAAESDEAKFLKSFNAAIKRNAENEQDGSEPDAQEFAANERVIARAERLNWTGLPNAATAHQSSATPPDTASLIDTITKLIARAISADAAPQAGQAARFGFTMPEGSAGLSQVQVIMTASSLDVVLLRHGAASGDDLATAANALADRLLARFSKRTVRVIERLIDDPKPISADEAAASERPEPFLSQS